MPNTPPTIKPFIWVLSKSKCVFSVNIEDNLTVDHLKNAIVKRKPNALGNVDADELTLWKVPISFSKEDEIDDEKLKNKRGNQKPLRSRMVLSDVFSQPPHVHESLIIVELPLSANSNSRNIHPPPENAALRSVTVSGLYARLQEYRLIQVRGTPGSGKTTLGLLIAEHIKKEEPNVKVIWVSEWPENKIEKHGGYLRYLRHKGWIQGEETVFIFDEAQMTYWNGELWLSLFKSLADYNSLWAILFASYGSPASRILVGSASRIPIFFTDEQRVSLKAICHNDHLPAVGLLFTRDEMSELIAQHYTGPKYYFDELFYDRLFLLTGGHVGAICDFVKVIVADESYRVLKGTDEHYTWDRFLAMVRPHDLFMKLANTTIFARGLPQDQDLQDIAVAIVFSKVLANGSITTISNNDSNNALVTCFSNGWLHTDRQGESVIYFFASPLHRWFVEWKIHANHPAPALATETGNILTFIINIIANFSPKRLATERQLPSGEIQSVPEAQYQDEFYQSCFNYANGSILTFPEYGTEKGRVDFYIPCKEWGVELLCDGDKLAKHSGRFSGPGPYAMSLSLKDYIILDCCTQKPQDSHPDIQKLYHVVFSNNFHDVSILNNTLVPVKTFQLDSA